MLFSCFGVGVAITGLVFGVETTSLFAVGIGRVVAGKRVGGSGFKWMLG